MSERAVSFAINEYYHVYNRGNSKQEIFRDDRDRARFMQLLHLSNGIKSFKVRELGKQDPYEIDMGERLVAVGSYCLMPNHFHILLKPMTENGVSQFMQKLGTGYSMYFNKRHDRSGSLFEGKFKSQHANNDEYLKYLFAYIHLNPVKLIQADWREKGIADLPAAMNYLSSFKFSSYSDLFPTGLACGKRKESIILDIDHFPAYFTHVGDHHSELQEWLSFAN